MKSLLRRLSRVADSSQYHPLHSAPAEGKEAAGTKIAGRGWGRRRRQRVPEGHVPVFVGEEMERFAVRAELLGRPAFVELLRWSAQEYGYDQVGVLHIPCSVPLFRRLLLLDFASAAADPESEELFPSLRDEIRRSESPA